MIQNRVIYSNDDLPERYNEALLKTTKLTREKNRAVLKALNFNYVENSWAIRAYSY